MSIRFWTYTFLAILAALIVLCFFLFVRSS